MREAFRVAPYYPGATPGEPGHPATFARTAQGGGRLDNPDLFATAYLSASPAGAVAEVFGAYPVWRPRTFFARLAGAPARYALVRFRLRDAEILDLDDPRNLLDRELRPSRIVITDREITQAWARRIYLEGIWTGVSWWSRWDPSWTSCGVWDPARLSVVGEPAPLDLDHPAIREAALTLSRDLTGV